MYVLHDNMYPKIPSKTCPTGDTAHDCHKLKIEHDITDKPVGKTKVKYDVIL